MTRISLIAGIIATTFVTTQPAFAASTVTTVDTSKYDLTMEGDVDAVHLKIVAAATRVCKAELRGWSYAPSKSRVVKKCVHGTTDDAVNDSGRKELAVYHDSLDISTRYDVTRSTPTALNDEMALLDR